MARQRKEVVVGPASDLPPGSHKVVNVEGREIGIFNVDGDFHALPNLCPHQIGPLCEGRVSGTLIARKDTDWKPQWVHEGEIVTCPWHGLEYHIATGQCLAFPEVRLRTYEVVVENEEIRLRI